MSVIITDGYLKSSLAIVRSLSKKGIEVTSAAESRNAICFSSKFNKGCIIYPSPWVDRNGFLQTMLREVKNKKYDLLFPISDRTFLPISDQREDFLPYIRLPIAKKSSIEKAFDKAETLRVAMENGIPVPKTYFVENEKQLNEISKQTEYPVVIKPRRTYIWKENRAIHSGILYANSPEELISKFMAAHNKNQWSLVQEYIPGESHGVFTLFNNGEPRAIFEHRRIKTLPPSGGASVLRESVALDPEMKDYAIRLLRTMEWHGVAMVEFKMDRRDNKPKLMEVNGRFWGSLALAIASGVDFPYLLYKMALEGDVEPVFEYKVGVKCRYLLGDLIHLINVIRGKDRKEGIEYPPKLFTLLEFLKFYGPDLHYDCLSLEDFKPAIIDFISSLKVRQKPR